jgi:hypothetical protein
MGASDRESTSTDLEDVDAAHAEGDDPTAMDLRTSTPDLGAVDEAWGEDDEPEEPEEPEQPLPDEHLDPVAYATAKKAREAREEAQRERRKVRAEAKKQRQALRAAQVREKQKTKQKRAGKPSARALAERAEREARAVRKEEAAEARRVMAQEREAAEEAARAEREAEEAEKRGARRVVRAIADDGRAEAIAKSAPPWNLVAVVLLVLAAGAVLLAVLRR